MEDSSQSATWFTWATALPEDLVRARPVLSVRLAHALLGRGEIEAAESWLTDAERWLEPGRTHSTVVDHDELRSLLAAIAVGRAYRAHSLGDVPSTVQQAQRVFELLPEGDDLRRQQATALMGLTYWAGGDLAAADRVFDDYSTQLLADGNVADAISAATVLAEVRPVLGRLRGATDALTQLLKVVVDRGEPFPPDTADLYRGLGELALERGDLEAATAHLRRSKEIGEQGGLPVWRWRWCVAQARLDITAGDLDEALALLDEAQRAFVRTPLPDVRPVAALRARIWVAQGRVTEALEWARTRGLSVDDDCSYLREYEHVTLAKALLAQHEDERIDSVLHGATSLLDRLLLAAVDGGRVGSVIEILALQALARQSLGDASSALASLERALTLADPESCARVFIDEGPAMAHLLEDAVSLGIAPDIARRVLAAFPAARPHGSDRCHEILSARENQVLDLIAAGLTNQEIAARLYLSLHTVKAHARSIYDKLDAHSRTQATARARALGILPLL